MNTHPRVPRVLIPFAVLTMFGPLPIMLLQHDPLHVHPAGLVFVAILLVAIARGSVLSWSIVLLWNAFLVFATASVLGSPGMASGAPLLCLVGLSGAAMQLTPAMRDHVGISRGHRSGRQAAAPL